MSRFRLFDLNPAQHEAATSTEGPLLILAGAGTGKTRVITARIAVLLSQNVPPSQILAVTFTNKAANEMKERIKGMVDDSKGLNISTFHSLCLRILRVSIEKLGYKNTFTIYSEGDQLGLIKKIINRTAASDENMEPNVAKSLISKAKNNGWRPPEDDETLIGAIYRQYQADLKRLNAVDFDDLLMLAVQLLNEHDDVRDLWSGKFRYIMVDEFQDTNKLQLDLVTLLSSTPPNVCVVGDDDQSIYGWRGAEVSNILEFEKHFPNPHIVKLEQNYRSTNAILKTANSLIKNNPRRRPKTLWSDNGAGDKVRLVQMPDDRVESEFVVEEIQRIQMENQLPWEEFAVLYRMNAQSRLLEANFRRLKIPYRLIGGKSFYDRREVKDILAYLSAMLNPSDDVSLLRIVNTPARGISATTVERALEQSIADRTSVFETLRSDAFLSTFTKKTAEAIRSFASLLDRYETRILEPRADYATTVKALIEETGYMDDLKRSCKTPAELLQRESSVHELLNALTEYQTRSDKRAFDSDSDGKNTGLQGFLDELTLDQQREEEDQDDNQKGVTLITLHAAKGLEFSHVHLVGLEDGILPHSRSKLEGTLDEERRLLYVGITRARKSLTMTYCANRLKYGSASSCTPSEFIKELAPDDLETTSYQTLMTKPVTEEAARLSFARMKEMIRGS
ncbi:MAG TPA: UvrD-helicase domain-containing protein [Chthoniobacterales bacterium]|jgi:superfamily I DNA/RNA helicase